MIVRGESRRLSSGKRGELDGTEYTAERLTELFGEPMRFDRGNKTTMEWSLTIGGVYVTIYDYRGFRWSIGGNLEAAAAVLAVYLDDFEHCIDLHI